MQRAQSYQGWLTVRPSCTISPWLRGPTAWVLIPCLGIYPLREDMSSAYPWIKMPPPLSLVSRLFTTRHHRSGNNTPPWGQPLDIANLREISIKGRNSHWFHHMFHVVCFLLGNSPASEFYMPTFRNTLSVPSS